MLDPQIGYAQIHTEQDLVTRVFFLQNSGNGKLVTPFGTNESALHALGDHFVKEALFQFQAVGNGEVKIYCLLHRMYVSAIGAGWPLFPRVEDESWSRFKLQRNPDGTICIASAQPIANGAYVSVIGENRILRIAEMTPRQPWSYFIPHAVNLRDENFADFVAKNKLEPSK